MWSKSKKKRAPSPPPNSWIREAFLRQQDASPPTPDEHDVESGSELAPSASQSESPGRESDVGLDARSPRIEANPRDGVGIANLGLPTDGIEYGNAGNANADLPLLRGRKGRWTGGRQDRVHESGPTSRAVNMDHPAWDGAGFSGGIITQIGFQQRAESQRVNIFLDGQYAFSLSAVIGLPLHTGASLERSEIAELLARDAQERAYDRALIFLAARPRSESEVRQRLREADFPTTAVDQAVERLLAQGLVNDAEFAQYWVGQRSTFRPRGTRALQAELRRKGVDSSTVEAALEPVEATQVEAACRAAQRKASRLALLNERSFGQALTPFLVRRGFDYPTIRSAVRVLWADRDTSVDAHDDDDVSPTA